MLPWEQGNAAGERTLVVRAAPLTMPCPFCFTGTCKKHPKQDHGKGAKSLGVADPKATLDRMFADTVSKQLEKMGSRAKNDMESIFDKEEAKEKDHQRVS